MTKFKKGDRVVVKTVKTTLSADFVKRMVGCVGTIDGISWESSGDDEYAYDAYDVVFDDGNGYFFFEDELELVNVR